MISEERIKTNFLLMDDLNYAEELTIKQNDDGHTNQYFRELMQFINQQINKSAEWIETQEAKELFYDEITYQRNFFEALEFQWERILSGKYEKIEDIINECYEYGKIQGHKDIQTRIRYTNADKLALTHIRNYNYNLIQKLDSELRRSIKNRIFQAVISGENPLALAPKLVELSLKPLPNSTLSPSQRAIMIARTEVSRAQNTGILQSYVNEGYTEVKILTAEDDNVCYLCLKNAYEFNDDDKIIFENKGDEKVHNIKNLIDKKQWVPLHPQCRCTYLSVWETKGEPPEKPYTTKLTNEESQNWSYDYKNKHYQLQGNTPFSREKFEMKYGIKINKLKPEEKLFLQIFTKKSRPLNDYLRSDNPDFDSSSREWDELVDDLIEKGVISKKLGFGDALNISESIFNKYSKPLKEDLIVCRREDERYIGADEKIIYDADGFTSTSIYEFAKEEIYGDQLTYILIPKDTPILYLEGITSSKRDYEVLFPPGIHLDHVENLSKKKQVWKLQ